MVPPYLHKYLFAYQDKNLYSYESVQVVNLFGQKLAQHRVNAICQISFRSDSQRRYNFPVNRQYKNGRLSSAKLEFRCKVGGSS